MTELRPWRTSSATAVLLAGAALLVPAPPTRAADWKPANGPLLTRWAKDVTPDKAHPEYPRPQLRRERWQTLNGLWDLAILNEDILPEGKDLPLKILVPFPVESALSGVMKRAERLFYRRTFTVPKEWAGQRVLLHFGAVDWAATVRVNGKKVGAHRGGYDPFTFDVTDALKDGEQEVTVAVWDPADGGFQPRGKQVRKPEGIYYTPTTGIWQTVWLEPVPKASIEGLRIVPDVAGGAVRVTVRGRGAADGQAVRVAARAGGKDVAEASGKVGEAVTLRIPGPHLWSPDDPFLYDLVAELRDGGRAVDRVDGYFGMRSIAVGPDDQGRQRLLLNGKYLFQHGPLDQGFWPDGLYTAPTDEALKFDIEMTKKLGFNMARKHVKVEPARWYYWCDKLGLLVWQDMPSGDKSIDPGKPDLVRSDASAKQYELELQRMIDNLHNHPSVVMWVVFNEGWGQFDTARITKWTKDYDPTRLVNSASGWNDHAGVGDVHDIHVYPGPGGPDPEPRRAAVLGEFGGLGLKVDGHTWEAKTWGYQGTRDREDLTRKYERLQQSVRKLEKERALSAAVYTQTTDVETEANGLMTYDRAVVKVDLDAVAAANRGDFSGVPRATAVVATSREKGQVWRYTFGRPGEGWNKPGFDDSAWKEGEGGFGTKGTPGALVRTEWKTDDVWLRREVELPEGDHKNLQLSMHHDDDAEVYLNGVPAARAGEFTTDYQEFLIDPKARATLKPGKNLIAVHCRQRTGGQYIDVGLVEVRQPAGK